MIIHEEKTYWGFNAMFMTENGESFGRVYWYDGDDESAVLDMLSVKEEYRNTGLGTIIQMAREDYARDKGSKTISLWCDANSWMKKWYENRGYEYVSDKEDEDNNIWMEKKL
jgi:GNAT superfamily N-acetyltransferase